MTSKEALECLQPFRWDDKNEIKAYEVLKKLVERDTPKSPIINTNHVFTQHNCSVCLSRLDIPQLKDVNFCPKCGQRIDWS